MGGADLLPGFCIKTGLGFFLANQLIEFEILVPLQTKLFTQGTVEVQRLLQQRIVMIPDDLGRWLVRAEIHMQIFVGFIEHTEGIPQPDNLTLLNAKVLCIHTQPAREQMRIAQQSLHGAGDQGPLAVKQGRHVFQLFGTDIRLVGVLLRDHLGIMLFHLEEGIDHIQLVGFFFKGTNQCQIGDDKTGGRLGHDIAAQEPVDQSIVELQVCGQRAATQRSTAQHIGEAFVAGLTVITLGEQQGDIGVIGAGDFILHEDAGVRVGHADALVITNLTLDRFRPVANHTAGVG